MQHQINILCYVWKCYLKHFWRFIIIINAGKLNCKNYFIIDLEHGSQIQDFFSTSVQFQDFSGPEKSKWPAKFNQLFLFFQPFFGKTSSTTFPSIWDIPGHKCRTLPNQVLSFIVWSYCILTVFFDILMYCLYPFCCLYMWLINAYRV